MTALYTRTYVFMFAPVKYNIGVSGLWAWALGVGRWASGRGRQATENCLLFFLFFFSIPVIIFALLVVTQIRGHMAASPPPLPATVRALHFCCEKISALSSLVDSRRIVLTHARRFQQLILFYFCK